MRNACVGSVYVEFHRWPTGEFAGLLLPALLRTPGSRVGLVDIENLSALTAPTEE